MLVVCVDDSPFKSRKYCQCHLFPGLRVGNIYTVAKIIDYPLIKDQGYVLEELGPILCDKQLITDEHSISSKRFRPIPTPDISILEAILKCPATPPTSLPSPPQKVPTTAPNVEVGHGRMRKGVGNV